MTGGDGKQDPRSPGSPNASGAAADSRESRRLAFGRFVEPEIEVMLRVAQTLTGSWADSEDLVQETMIRAYGAIERFDGRHPRAWLLTILRRAHLNAHRRRRPGLLAESGSLERYRPAFGARSAPSAEDAVTEQILDEKLEAAVQRLDPRFRLVLLLVDVDQLTYTEAAEVLGIPTGTVMSRLSRARARIRTDLRGAGISLGRTP